MTELIVADIKLNQEKARVFGIVCTVTLLLFFVPLTLVLRKKSGLHERVFDLLTSIDSEEITKQVDILLYTDRIVNNYR